MVFLVGVNGPLQVSPVLQEYTWALSAAPHSDLLGVTLSCLRNHPQWIYQGKLHGSGFSLQLQSKRIFGRLYVRYKQDISYSACKLLESHVAVGLTQKADRDPHYNLNHYAGTRITAIKGHPYQLNCFGSRFQTI